MSKAAELAALIGSQTALSNRNLVINSAMQVAQRGDVSGITGSSYGGPDRFELNASNIGTFTISQSSTAPAGFKNSWKVDCTTADASPASEDLLRVSYRIEGQDLQQLAYGTSSAKAITLSFYVRSNKAGTYNVQFQQIDNSFKQAVLSYTIDSADTWEFKSITVPGDTSGLINDDSGDGLALFWVLGAGSFFSSGSERSTYTAFANGDVAPTQTVNLADNTANEWMITGVQLEVGEQATPFEHRSFGDELARCQRYFCKSYALDKYAGATDDIDNQCTLARIQNTVSNRTVENAKFPVRMRIKPTLTVYSLNGTSGNISDTATNAGTHSRDEPVNISKYGETGIAWFTSVNAMTAGDGGGFHFIADAEL
jgi:hypothetical protein